MRVGLPPSVLPPAVPISEGEPVPVLPCQDRVVRGVRAPQMDAPVAGVTLDECSQRRTRPSSIRRSTIMPRGEGTIGDLQQGRPQTQRGPERGGFER